ncbi:nicotinamide riboside transporter PnuC [Aridibaculum aurantiacum]|uniref:nicotinamide riboside transporter PnuC n=1 Tax=Aridibaculum aurantiacum TaxID=2810307 RepID=UPI001A9740EB|nr:nicotinamide riboside transporter PnuC [Aridibaculum aurantiacum]
MDLHEIYQQFVLGLLATTWYEALAVVAGITSVWFSKKENILVYPVGLVNTILYVYLSIDAQLFGEATVNLYYTIMSIYGWLLWSKKDRQHHPVLHVTHATAKEWLHHLLFFAAFYIAIYAALVYVQKAFWPGAIPWADALASATAFTGMWLMAKKKVESWIWWILTNIASIPLYFVKGFVFTSVYYFILLLLAFAGLAEWNKRAKATKREALVTA